MFNFSYAYAIIEKSTNYCIQVNQNNKSNWVLDADDVFNIPVPVESAVAYAGKYFYDNQWWRREWVYEEVTDENGNTYQKKTGEYTDYPWSPEESIN